jgi:hypothetical protein
LCCVVFRTHSGGFAMKGRGSRAVNAKTTGQVLVQFWRIVATGARHREWHRRQRLSRPTEAGQRQRRREEPACYV